MELDDFARAVNRYGHTKMVPRMVCTISDTLIHMLESTKGCVTHPVIANAIAEYCDATPEQRDMIVAKEHRGRWKPRQGVVCARPPMVRFNNAPNGAKPIVKVDINGNVLMAYESCAAAARRESHNEDWIRSRCKRKGRIDFTSMMPYTFRYQDEWLDMSREEQLEDIHSRTEYMG